MYSLGFSKLPSLNSKMWESFWEATLQNERRFRIRKGNVPLYFSIVITKLDDVKIILRRQLYKITDFVMSDKNLRNFRNRPVWYNQISILLKACLKNIEVKVLQFCYIILMPYPCSHFYFDIKFGVRLYSKEKKRGWPVLFWI